MLFSPQIPLQLEPRRPDRFEDFVAGPNAAVLASVKNLLNDFEARDNNYSGPASIIDLRQHFYDQQLCPFV